LPLFQEERMDSLLFELIAVKFDLADRASEVERLRRQLDAVNEAVAGKASRTPSPYSDTDNELHSVDMLYLAAEEGLDEIVKGILNPKPTRQGMLGDVFGHALRRAAGAGHLNIAKRLLSVDAHLNTRSTGDDGLFQCSLHVAAANGHEPVLRLLLSHAKEKQVRYTFICCAHADVA
jgi:hypothetical protein